MDWKQKLDQLPVIFHTPLLQDLSSLKAEECLQGKMKGATYIATRAFLPTLGIVYTISLGGSQRGRKYVERQIIKQLGIPEVLDRANPYNIWIYLWKSESQEIPKTEVHETLGQDRINQICQQYGLDKKDMVIIDTCLATIRATMGTDPLLRISGIAYALQVLSDKKRAKVTMAVFRITQEFAIKKQLSNN